jgi:hypothetical protein
MALQKSIDLMNGINLPEAYIKISSIEYNNADTLSVRLSVDIFKDQDSRNSKKPEVVKYDYTISGDNFTTYFSLNVLSQDGKNILQQGYEYLKSIDFYKDAIDITDDKEV